MLNLACGHVVPSWKLTLLSCGRESSSRCLQKPITAKLHNHAFFLFFFILFYFFPLGFMCFWNTYGDGVCGLVNEVVAGMWEVTEVASSV